MCVWFVCSTCVQGGAVYINGGEGTFSNCIFTSNRADNVSVDEHADVHESKSLRASLRLCHKCIDWLTPSYLTTVSFVMYFLIHSFYVCLVGSTSVEGWRGWSNVHWRQSKHRNLYGLHFRFKCGKCCKSGACMWGFVVHVLIGPAFSSTHECSDLRLRFCNWLIRFLRRAELSRLH